MPANESLQEGSHHKGLKEIEAIIESAGKAVEDAGDKIEDAEEEVVEAIQHMKSMCDGTVLAAKNEVEEQIRQQQEEYIKNKNWFVATVYLRKKLVPESSNHACWHSTKPYRVRIIKWIEQPRVEVCILFLVLSDMVMVVIEAILDGGLFEFHADHGEGHGGGSHGGGHGTDSDTEHDTPENASEHSATSDDDGIRRLRMVIRTAARPIVRRWVQEGSRFLAAAGGEDSCDDITDQAYKIASACRTVSLIILWIFATEICIKLACAPKGFVRHAGHVLDVIVIGGSLAFEYTIHHSTGGLLIFFRSWRFVRIVHGLYEQVEYISKALETEAHLEKALAIVQKYKTYTKTRNLRDDWQIFKKQGEEGLKNSKTKVTVISMYDEEKQPIIEGGADLHQNESPPAPQMETVESKEVAQPLSERPIVSI